VLVARRAHGMFGKKALRRSLGDLRHVRVEMVPGKNFRDPFTAIFALAGVPRDVVMTVPSYAVAAEVVAASDLVTMLQASVLAAKRRDLRLRAIDASLPTRVIPIAMCWHEKTHADPTAQAFRAIVKCVATSPAS
jgi:DNA-binding transcriptional LysR family regulator